MNIHRPYLQIAFLILQIIKCSAALHYVNVANPAPVSPYGAWSTAATNIQDAVDAAAPSDQIIVADGVYNTRASVTSDGTTNRLTVSKPLTLQSVNGPTVTLIDGGNALRCAYLTNGVVLIGFTLRNGTAAYGGGVYCTSSNVDVSNCLLINNSAGIGGGAYSGTLDNCTLSGNANPRGARGGGAAGSILNECRLNGNTTGNRNDDNFGTPFGGGAADCTLNNCTLIGNKAYGTWATGGGAADCTLNNCTVAGCYAEFYGGGTYDCTLNNCTVSNENYAQVRGGGVLGGTLNNCVVSGNVDSGVWGSVLNNCAVVGNNGIGAYSCTLTNCVVSSNIDGGASASTLNNCTLVANIGIGASSCTLNNCINYYNGGGNNSGNTINFSCTPDKGGIGSITNAPRFDVGYHLLPDSPCIDAGNSAYVTASTDYEGYLRIQGTSVDMGAYEFQPLIPLTVGIHATLTNAPVEYPVIFSPTFFKGRANLWDFGDGTVVSNQLSVSHSWTLAGDYPVILTAYDSANPDGVSASLTIHVRAQIIYYVNAAGTNSVPPYDSWNTAATNIQDAIDLALPVPRSLVLATNGVYQSGGRVVYGSLTNRVVINKPITVQSLNGPAVTEIEGNRLIGDNAVRCVYMANNAILNGFTLSNGATRNAGDSAGEQSGGGVWCESSSAVVSNCVLIANSAASEGGGIYGGTLASSLACSNNAAFTAGFGNGGGASFSVLNNCVLLDNFAGAAGGGANNSTLNGSSITGNWSGGSGGGADASTLNNCTLTSNKAVTGGGANSSTLNNCIVYYNLALNGPNYSGGTLNYCCTLPAPGNGDGNTTAEPKLADSAHISADSPCRGAGSANYYGFGLDLDFQSWLNPPSIGCDEFYDDTVTGTLSVSAQLSHTNVAAGFIIDCAGKILGHATVGIWDFGDGTAVTNHISVSHAWSSSGVYSVVLTAYNNSNPDGVSVTNIVYVLEKPVHYVSLGTVNPVPPYLSWSTAATNIQDAVDAAFYGATVLVTNGVYQTGGKSVSGSLTNRVVIDKTITVQSVNGPETTFIQGYQLPGTANGDEAIRCVYMTNNTALFGFTLRYGATRTTGDPRLEQRGGGIFSESSSAVVSNCILTANSAAEAAGGAYGCTLNSCTVSDNSAGYVGGGAAQSVLLNCTLTGNSAQHGGAAYDCTLDNSLLTDNYAMYFGGGVASSVVAGSVLNACVLRNNVAALGGGAAVSILNNCLLLANSAGSRGGGAESCAMFNCTVVGNSSGDVGGGVADMGGNIFDAGSIVNCVIYYNTAASDGANSIACSMNNCCSMPEPAGTGNITNAPLFIDLGGANLRLQSNSPCINSGAIDYAPGVLDLEGNPRVKGDKADIGAYEYQTPSSILPYVWAQRYALATDGTADYADTDTDGVNNWNEWRSGTDPTDPSSVLKMLPLASTNNSPDMTVTWQSVNGLLYYLQRSSDLEGERAFSTIQSNIIGMPGTTSFTDSGANMMGPYFYRIGVK
jgi:hypothetical protein